MTPEDGAVPSCQKDEQRCNLTEREFCKDGAWTAVETCVGQQFCHESNGFANCVDCEPFQSVCVGDDLHNCTEKGTAGSLIRSCEAGSCQNGTCPVPEADVDVLITADNAYGFGYGSETQLANYFGGVEAKTAGEIFNCPIGNGPEEYTVPGADAGAGDYLYIVAYADSSTTQGVIGQFKRRGGTKVVYTGVGEWQVCATGKNFSPGSNGPTMEEINTEIVSCNGGDTDPSTTSKGWVGSAGNGVGSLAVGEDNSTARASVDPGNEFPIVCSIDKEAKWIWYNWDPVNIVWPAQSPFIWPSGSGTNPDKQFLIFRLKAEQVTVQ